jgi:CRISPR-associated protein Cas1
MVGRAMSVLYVTQPGAELRKTGRRIEVWWRKELLFALPLRSVERVVLLGPAQVSAAAARALLGSGIPLVFCSARGRYYGTLSPGAADADSLLAQTDSYRNDAFRVETARGILAVKMHHQRALLQRHSRNHPDPMVAGIAAQIGQLLKRLPLESTVPELMGLEGHASALYFSAFGLCLRKEGVVFEGRNRHPPRDPVNAALSLGYMLVLQEVVTALAANGLHPGIGFLHEVSSRRPALALDVLEVARQPVVDRLTLSLFNLGILGPEDFRQDGEGEVRLTERGLRRYLQYYERTMITRFRGGRDGREVTFRQWLMELSREGRDCVRSGTPWKPEPLKL